MLRKLDATSTGGTDGAVYNDLRYIARQITELDVLGRPREVMADPATSFIIQTIYNVARGKVEREAAIIMGACRLLMIDKKGGGERPIAIGHIYRCLAGRFLERTSRKRRIEAFGPKQMATQPNGTTTAALSMHINIETVMNQETSQSLIPLSQTQDPGSSIADSSQSKPWD